MLNTRINIRNQEEYAHIYVFASLLFATEDGRSVFALFFFQFKILYFMHKLLFARDTKLAQANDDYWLELFVLFSPTKKAVRHIEILLMVCIYQKRKKPSKINDILIERKNPIKGAGWLHSYGIQLN